MNNKRKLIFPSIIFFVVLIICMDILGVWNPFKKESWEELGKDIAKGATTAYEKTGEGVTTAYEETKKGVTKAAEEVGKGVTKVGGDIAKGTTTAYEEAKEGLGEIGKGIQQGVSIGTQAITRALLGLTKEPKITPWTVKPTLNTKLNEFMWVCTHNAFSSTAHGYGLYRQQDTSMLNQLKAGVRALMLDVYVGKGEVRLTHNQPKFDKVLRPGTFTEGMKLWEELKRLKEGFFDKDHQAVVFLILQDVVPDANVLDRAFEKSGMAARILKPSEWDPVANQGWPTIRWMKQNNKQLILFSDKKSTQYIYPGYKNVVENNVGYFDPEITARERGASKEYADQERYLFLFNYFQDPLRKFPEATKSVENFMNAVNTAIKGIKDTDFNKVNNIQLKSALNYLVTRGPVVFRNRYPNFVAVDFAAKGGVFKVVDEFNKKATGKERIVFRPLVTVEK
jgi:hypothetical protein